MSFSAYHLRWNFIKPFHMQAGDKATNQGIQCKGHDSSSCCCCCCINNGDSNGANQRRSESHRVPVLKTEEINDKLKSHSQNNRTESMPSMWLSKDVLIAKQKQVKCIVPFTLSLHRIFITHLKNWETKKMSYPKTVGTIMLLTFDRKSMQR